MRHVAIVGNGIAGITLARELRKRSGDKITVIASETRHFYSRPALMYIYMGHMKFEHTKPYEDWFWDKNRIDLVLDRVEVADFKEKTLRLSSGRHVVYDSLVLATGSKSNMFGWPGQDLRGVQGLYGYPDLIAMEENTQGVLSAVVVGGGLIGVEMAEMLLSREIRVTFLVRERTFWNMVLPAQEGRIIERHIREHHVDLRMESELKEIVGDAEGRVKQVVTKGGEVIPCEFVGLTVGVSPNVAFLKGGDLEIDRGILVDEYFRTNVPDVHAAGDCAQFRKPLPGRRPIEQVWYTGKMQAECLARNLAGAPRPYAPGIWFNSAKFFDIEYQTYGTVPAQPVADEESFYWEHPGGGKAVRIHYRKTDAAVLGFNFLGIRARHLICERWIAEGRDLRFVLQNLGALNFDPEFFAGFETSMRVHFNALHPQQPLRPEARKGLFSRLAQGLRGSQAPRGTQLKEAE